MPRCCSHDSRTANLEEALRFVVQNLQGFETEGLDDLRRPRGADTTDLAGSQKATQPFEGRWRDVDVGLDLELVAVLGMLHPSAGEAELVTLADAKQRSDGCHGHRVFGLQADRAPAVLFVAEEDPADRTLDGFAVCASCILRHGLNCTAECRRHHVSMLDGRSSKSSVRVSRLMADSSSSGGITS